MRNRMDRARRGLRAVLALAAVAAIVAATLVPDAGPSAAQGTPGYELWVVDQSDAANGGAKVYIYGANQLSGSMAGAPEVIDLQTAAADVGDGPAVRPHLLLFNNAHTHGILAGVASGHVLFIRGADRQVVGSVDVGDQAHGAVPSPNDRYALVANQNGKRLARIRTDYAAEQFVHEGGADLDLGALEDADHPDNAPICPLMFVGPGGDKAYVTVRGGGLYVVDTAATPMRVLRDYGRGEVAPAGCGGVAIGDKVYINSGTANSSDLYVMDADTDAIVKHLPLSDIGFDAHGMVLTGGGRYLWMGFRASGNVAVVDTETDEVVNIFSIGAGRGQRPQVPGAAPDLMDVSPGAQPRLVCEPSSTVMCIAPGGDRVFVTMRGPTPLTGGAAAAGDRAGIEVLALNEGGRAGTRVAFIPIGDPDVDIHAGDVDLHGIAVRLLNVPLR
jgi:DNA-binding beta-propeller fold protein YncE